MIDPSDILPDSIAQARAEILRELADVANPAPVLVAVSKQQPDHRIAAILATGQIVFGENRVQEAQTRWTDRFADARAGLELRLIGPLQSNKTQDAVELFDVIETLDREKLAKALVKAADVVGRLPRLYVQVNTGEEPQKSGVLPRDLAQFLDTVREVHKLPIEGLMCIPPSHEAPSPHFWLLSDLAQKLGVEKLSMGMSGDYLTAAKMGATSVRIGSALFGARPK